jgi:hypothetical protein
VVLTYSNHFRNDFHFDDAHTIQNNLFIRDVRNIPRFFTTPATFSSLPANQSYRPLVTTTLAFDYRLAGGLKPTVFHFTSFTLFLAQCVALLVLYRRLMDASRPHPMNRWLALFAATWYALHTAIAETVNYVIARSDIMSSLGTVLAVLMYASRGRARAWHLYLIPAAAAVLSKEQGVMVAPILFAYTALFERNLSLRDLLAPREFLAALRSAVPAFVLCTGILLMGMSLSTNYNPGGERWPYLITQPYALLHYALMFVAPVDLTADTDWQPFTTVFDGRVFVGLLFIAASIWTAFVASRRTISRPIAFGILWFFLSLVPSSSVIPLSEVVNDHRMYFAFVGLILSASWAIGLVVPRLGSAPQVNMMLTAAALVVLAAHAAGTTVLARTALELSPAHIEAKELLDSLTAARLTTPEQWLERSLRQYQGRFFGDSITSSREALKLRPDYAEAFNNICAAENQLGRYAEAITACERAIAIKPDFPLARNNLAYARDRYNPAR